jgi:hypothetical protein
LDIPNGFWPLNRAVGRAYIYAKQCLPPSMCYVHFKFKTQMRYSRYYVLPATSYQEGGGGGGGHRTQEPTGGPPDVYGVCVCVGRSVWAWGVKADTWLLPPY